MSVITQINKNSNYNDSKPSNSTSKVEGNLSDLHSEVTKFANFELKPLLPQGEERPQKKFTLEFSLVILNFVEDTHSKLRDIENQLVKLDPHSEKTSLFEKINKIQRLLSFTNNYVLSQLKMLSMDSPNCY